MICKENNYLDRVLIILGFNLDVVCFIFLYCMVRVGVNVYMLFGEEVDLLWIFVLIVILFKGLIW